MGKGSGSGAGPFPTRRGVISQIPTRNGIYTIKLSALKDVAYTNFVGGRMESIEQARREGKKLPPLRLIVEKSGNVEIEDGNHRLRVARAHGDDTITARFSVWQGKGTWAAKEAKRRGRTRG